MKDMEIRKKHSLPDGSNANIRCKVCGGLSTGVHYGVISCEGCKAFYKRGIINGIKYKCYFGSQCPVTAGTRGRRCKACRFRRCQEEGMDVRAVKGSRSWRANGEKPVSSPSTSDSTSAKDDYPQEQDHSLWKNESTSLQPGANLSSVIRLGNFAGSCVVPLRRKAEPEVDYGTVLVRHNQASDSPRVKVIRTTFDKERSGSGSMPAGEMSVLPYGEPDHMPTSAARIFRENGHNSKELVPVSRSNLSGADGLLTGLRRSTTNLFSSWLLSDLLSEVTANSMDTSDCASMPNFLCNYVRAMTSRSMFLTETISRMHTTVQSAIAALDSKFESFQSHPLFMQKDATVETERRVLKALQHDIGHNSLCFKVFLQALPGFAELNPRLLQKLIPQRYINFWLFFHSKFYYNDEDREVYILADIDLDRRAYFVDRVCEKEYAEFIYKSILHLRQLHIDDVMRYLLLVVSVVFPGSTLVSDEDKAALATLYAHYSEALMQCVANHPDGKRLAVQLQDYFTKIPMVNHVASRYVTQLDFSSIPLRMVSGERYRDIPWGSETALQRSYPAFSL